MNNFHVYKLTSPSNKIYIGITSNLPKRRWNNGNGYRNSTYIKHAILKYGWENFKHEIIASNLSKEEAINLEIKLIKELNTTNPNIGYNITLGGEGTFGYFHSEETKMKISQKLKGKKKPPRSEKVRKSISEKLSKPILQFSLKGEFIREWKNSVEIKKLSPSLGRHANECCNGKRKTAGGYIWKFKNK